jgi:hypothetical protein
MSMTREEPQMFADFNTLAPGSVRLEGMPFPAFVSKLSEYVANGEQVIVGDGEGLTCMGIIRESIRADVYVIEVDRSTLCEDGATNEAHPHGARPGATERTCKMR